MKFLKLYSNSRLKNMTVLWILKLVYCKGCGLQPGTHHFMLKSVILFHKTGPRKPICLYSSHSTPRTPIVSNLPSHYHSYITTTHSCLSQLWQRTPAAWVLQDTSVQLIPKDVLGSQGRRVSRHNLVYSGKDYLYPYAYKSFCVCTWGVELLVSMKNSDIQWACVGPSPCSRPLRETYKTIL